MNFNIDEKLFGYKNIWDGLSASEHRAMTIVLNQIVHWSRQKGVCELREGKIERLYKIPRKDIVTSRNKLLALKLIKCIKEYDCTTQQPAVYSCTTGLWQITKKAVVNNTKAIVSGTMDNNYNNNYRDEGVFSDTSSEDTTDLNTFLSGLAL